MRLWKITGVNFAIGFLNCKLHNLWAAPQYFPVNWQWSRTLSTTPSFFNERPQIQQFFAFTSSFIFLHEDHLLGEIKFFVNLSQISFEHLNKDLTDIFSIVRSENHRISRSNLIVKANDLVRKSTWHMLLILTRETLFIARFTRIDWFHDRFEIHIDNEGDFDHLVMILELNLFSIRHFDFQLFIVWAINFMVL